MVKNEDLKKKKKLSIEPWFVKKLTGVKGVAWSEWHPDAWAFVFSWCPSMPCSLPSAEITEQSVLASGTSINENINDGQLEMIS